MNQMSVFVSILAIDDDDNDDDTLNGQDTMCANENRELIFGKELQ